MTYPVHFARQAVQDLSDSAACLHGSDGEMVATRFVDTVARLTRSLEDSPTLGTPCDMHSVRRRDLKRLALPAPFAAWKIYYAVLFGELRIERILCMAPQPQEVTQLTAPSES